MTSNYLYLGLAIVAEVAATSLLKQAEGFTRLWPSLVVVVGYGLAFFFLSLTLRTIPTGVAYAIWSGAGIVLVSAIGWLALGQRLDAAALIGIGLILAGVLVINLFSRTAGH
ncbi:Multidrug transporter EmrE [Pigmentiphaga humi]|uniref:Multidrug transporter EmrE n=1 Tax=Pigmentiphaga humi TaxID=2478468 RepID=A0A3P4B3J1_9BURK|nr:SMR family transporter [Pigmentiphaga humi]VCU70863.1 Multidrug transporter EmrE [Pigmentiphaga humi]